jgi:hypothetical protein
MKQTMKNTVMLLPNMRGRIFVKLKLTHLCFIIMMFCGMILLQGCVLLDVFAAVASSRSSSNNNVSAVNSSNPFGSLEGCSIIANDGTFLGIISSNKYNADSIINTYGKYGSKYNTNCIFNTYGQYGGSYSLLSPFNKYATTPPVIYKGSNSIAYLTVNTTLSPRVDPYALIGWLQAAVTTNEHLAKQGIKPDDKFVSIGNQKILPDNTQELKTFIKENHGKPVNVTVEREGKHEILTVTIP